MEKITLRNFKSEVIVGILALILGAVILYWGLQGDMKLRISGANLDESTSAILLCLISIGPFVTGINYILKFFSILRYGEFVIHLTNDSITYPENAFFRGFKAVTLPKKQLSSVTLVTVAQNEQQIYLNNHKGQLVAVIPGELAPYKTMKPEELAAKIQTWLHTN